ncbi:hypothetical protein [Singulisphaera acidiphila]|uniref:Uncharacterized protein n=1 Tax=Singulisphaera acidiphila (strain ATCC BAA-1392 / DSM 18658 / VKM B-2454 / MOB10) TaxID=886293 RepID=L0DE93_SINAD|nr:hypothetical protein [Singulisphaera acidiphila]AGA26971.1 hypothetical protein Sinac_2670 [Singulisphaera acidiphila DSM 18658]
MNAASTIAPDPHLLAEEVRDLATRAYETLHDPLTDPQETRELSERISHLQGLMGSMASNDLSLWLENLRRRVDAPASHAVTTGSGIRRLAPSPSE